MPRRLPLAMILALGASPALAAAEPSEAAYGPGILGGGLVRGEFWGVAPASAAARLGGGPAAVPGLGQAWFVEPGLSRLLGLDAGSRRAAEFARVELSTRSWVLSAGGRFLGLLLEVPVDDWDAYEAPARKRFGEPRKSHFKVEPSSGSAESARYMHVYRWGDARTRFVFMKATTKDTAAYWLDRNSDTLLRLRVNRKLPDGEVPLFIGIFDEKLVRSLGKPPYLRPLEERPKRPR